MLGPILYSVPALHPVHGLPPNTSAVYISPLKSSSPSSLTVSVDLNLSSSDTVAGYEVYMSYNNSLLNIQNVLPGNLFPPSRVLNITQCVNGASIVGNCTTADGPNVVHWNVAYLDGFTSGPLVAQSLFTVNFSVAGRGHSIFQVFNDTIFGALQQSGEVPDIIHASYNGIYSNSGLQAFFNVGPALLIVGRPVSFDASGTFNSLNNTSSYNSSLNFTWFYGDGSTPAKNAGPMPSHTYTATGRYDVALTVTDYRGVNSTIFRTITIVTALGGLDLIVQDTKGNASIPYAVYVDLYNGSLLVESLSRAAGNTGHLVVPRLSAGTYRLDFYGTGITSASVSETVIAGWTTTDRVNLTVQTASPPPVSPVELYLLIAAVVGSVLIIGVSVYRIWKDRRERKKNK